MMRSDDTVNPATSGGKHSAFELLDRRLQRQLYAMHWTSLRPIQVRAIKSFMESTRDLVLMAETAAGKTEAAFLPILSVIADEPLGSVRAIYVGPLKALINDQFQRVEQLCTHLDVPVHRWHGDVGASRKSALIESPGGVLLITPESLESLLVNRTRELGRLLGGVRAIVIDELHAFLTGERGLHLASLLGRIERYRERSGPPIRRLGLSATIGDADVASRYLNRHNPEQVEVIHEEGASAEILLRMHGYDAWDLAARAALKCEPATAGVNSESEPDELIAAAIAEDLVEHCRSYSNLIFANAKGDIEIFADLANEGCRKASLPEVFLVHHGSLSKDVREDAEAEMKSGRSRTTVCSSTLEMGIDIGSVRLVGQIGAPWSVSSLKQRMGRSGRKSGEPRRLRCYVDCTTRADSNNPLGALPLELLQAIAVCDLMLDGWVEPPIANELDLSTLTHQVISTISETGALPASELYARLCVDGPFSAVGEDLFVRLLRALGAADILEQGSDSHLILGLVGERLRSKRDFYAAFASRVEFTVLAGSRVLGALPVESLPKVGDHIVFAARRWQVAGIDPDRRELYVAAATRRERPKFLSAGGRVHHRVVERMRLVLAGSDDVSYLGSVARRSLATARTHAQSHGLAQRRHLALSPKSALWLTWSGTAETTTYEALLTSVGISCQNEFVGLRCDCSTSDLDAIIRRWSERPPDLATLAEHVQSKRWRKYDEYLPDDLLEEVVASTLIWRSFDVSTAAR